MNAAGSLLCCPSSLRRCSVVFDGAISGSSPRRGWQSNFSFFLSGKNTDIRYLQASAPFLQLPCRTRHSSEGERLSSLLLPPQQQQYQQGQKKQQQIYQQLQYIFAKHQWHQQHDEQQQQQQQRQMPCVNRGSNSTNSSSNSNNSSNSSDSTTSTSSSDGTTSTNSSDSTTSTNSSDSSDSSSSGCSGSSGSSTSTRSSESMRSSSYGKNPETNDKHFLFVVPKSTRSVCIGTYLQHTPFSAKRNATFSTDASSKDTKKVEITFVAPDGAEKVVGARIGETILETAHANGVELEGACDGQCSCSTCHVILEAEVYEELPEPSEKEEDMLDMAACLTSTSRLGCQVRVTEALRGTKIRLPQLTRNFYVDGHVPSPH